MNFFNQSVLLYEPYALIWREREREEKMETWSSVSLNSGTLALWSKTQDRLAGRRGPLFSQAINLGFKVQC